ncbi:flavin-containing monooxygenase [Pontixanthobacter aquaemixtae]|uniref:NAD(P)-binding protein n=1 Tax=Pontixanthobacter aquaemixtae TaxID=1958940 RepID=A0A844ZQZ3_9SPHN|nr:NAD(P)/FAD-dependent oxidoreductase [Pontixanthobacter aquaemixtae]MXO89954.1 NAD(P)-binding protein [Pontixanthobacter aquaemixtae]
MTSCKPSNVPPVDEIDIAALQERYALERERRLKRAGGKQYVQPSGGAVSSFVSDPHKEITPREPISDEIDVVILGAGWGGVLASYYLTKQGVTDFRCVDTAGDFGGVWYWNQYPGIQCDNESYCYLPLLEETGFMPSKKFADGWEIQGYARQIAEQFGFADKALFHTMITSLVWDEDLQRWHVGTNRGDNIKARFVVMANGVLNMPKLPAIEGIESFKGKIFHTARWDYDYTGGKYGDPTLEKLSDKKVALVGTGATAIQAVPFLAESAQHLYVVQRTPSCVDARPNPPTDTSWLASLSPGWQKERQDNFHRGAMEAYGPDDEDLVCDFWTEINRNMKARLEQEGWPEISEEEFLARRMEMDHRVMERMRRRVDELVEDGEVAEALKPYYNFMCKRPLSSDAFYPAFNRKNVELIDVADTKGLQKITEKGFVANGEEYEADCIIFASGFEVTSALERRWGIDRIEGREGKSLYDHWRNGPQTLHGTMTHGFPNQFYIGYIQGGLNASVTEQFGRQGEHIAYVIAEALEKGAVAVEPTEEAMRSYTDHFKATQISNDDLLNICPPSYFSNEGADTHEWGLFRQWGGGWHDFTKMLADWRDAGQLEGMDVRLPETQS